jgi:nickel-dependent lactate racemase
MDIVSTTDEDQLIYQDQLKELVEKLKGEIVVLSNDNTELKASVAECINRIKELKELGVDDANV